MQDIATPSVEMEGGYSNTPAVTADEHSLLVQWFEDSEEARRDARELAHRCRDYYDSKQLTSEQRAALERRGQPPVVINRVASKVNFLLGLEAQQRTDPKAAPRTPQDEDAAEAATDALRYVEERTQLDMHLSMGYEDMLIEGECAVEIGIREVSDPKTGGMRKEIDIKCWRFDRVFADPHSSRHDYSDARYKGGVLWMDREQAEARWPNHKALFEMTFQSEYADHYDDKPSWKHWTQSGTGRDRVRIVQIYWQSGNKWKWAIYCKGGVLEGGDVPYVNSDGESECPLEMQACYIDRENNRYGIVKALLDPQDEINKRRSKLLHHMSVRQLKISEGAVEDEDETRREFAKPDGIIKVNPGFEDGVEVLQTNDMAAGQVQLLQHAQQVMDEMGANNALRGVTGNQASGRAIQASQQGGQLEVGIIQDRHRDLKLRVYRQIWNRIRQFWDDERWVRVTDNEQNAKFAQLNAPVTLKEKLAEEADKQAEQMKEQGASEEQIQQFFQQTAQQIEMSHAPEELEQVVEIKNDPAKMDMDIILDTAPDTVIIQQEQFEELTKLLQTGMELQDPRMRLLISASNLRDKKELLAQIDDSQKENPMQQKMQQMEMKNAELKMKELETTIQEKLVKMDETMAKIEKMQAETSSTSVSTEINMQDALDGRMDGMLNPQPREVQ